MMKTVLIVLGILVLVTAAGVTWARYNGYCSPDNRIQHISERIGRKLDLNGHQQGQLNSVAEVLSRLRDDWRDHRAETRDHVAELLRAPKLDRDRAAALIEGRLRDIQGNSRALVGAFADFSDSLSAEQRSHLGDFIASRMAQRRGNHHWAH
jgi:uncharacterized membrane protein